MIIFSPIEGIDKQRGLPLNLDKEQRYEGARYPFPGFSLGCSRDLTVLSELLLLSEYSLVNLSIDDYNKWKGFSL